jgi:protein-export membrane protein SecD
MNLRIKWTFLIVVLLTFGWYLLPTIRYYSMSEEVRKDANSPKVQGIRQNAMRLGLDLQGGAYLVYEVDLDKIPEDKRTGDEVDRAIEIIRNRVDQFGVTEPVIQKQGERRIVVQLPGLQDPTRAKDLVGKTARLDFLLVKNQQEFLQALSRVDQIATRRGLTGLAKPAAGETPAPTQGLPDSMLATLDGTTASADSAGADTAAAMAAADTGAAEAAVADSLLASGRPFSSLLQQTGSEAGIGFCPDANYDAAKRILDAITGDPSDGPPRSLPGGTVLLWGDQEFAGTQNPGRYLYAVTDRAEITGENVASASVAFGLEPARPNAAGVSLNFDKQGATKFTRLTGNNVGRQLAIVLDHKVKSAPVIRDKIRGGRASITGIATDNEARDLGIVLRAGALPTDLIPQEERTVGPTLGRDSIEQGIRAALVGLALVVLFMSVYYQASGLLSVLALALNLFFLISTLGMLRGTLTLPGIAGIVLTIGMAVDANVLILERIREEIRTGKTVRGAIDAGYGRALVTILDSNITTLISSIVLFQFGTGPIKGFATTLMIGIVANIFTAVFVTRLIYDSVMAKRPIKKLSI